MSYQIIDTIESYLKSHDGNNIERSKKTVYPRFVLENKSQEVLTSSKDSVTPTLSNLNLLSPIGSYNLFYKKDSNEISSVHYDDGKWEGFMNVGLFNHKNLRTSVYAKQVITQKENTFLANWKLHLDENKLFVFGMNRDNSLEPLSFKNYFKHLSIAGFYGFSRNNNLQIVAGAKAGFNLESKSLSSGTIYASADYKDFKNTLKFGRFKNEKVYFLNYTADAKINGMRVAADLDYTNKASDCKLSEVKDSGIKIGLEFPIQNDTWAKVMVNNKKEVFTSIGRNFGTILFTFGTKVSANSFKSLKYDFAASLNFN